MLTPNILRDRGVSYHDNTRTSDTWRYAKTNNLPLTTQFTDSTNVEWKVKLVFEALYGLDFFNTELFFRGLLVFVFVRFLGPNAIYAIAVTYCVCHFGKPLAEAISSFFGGYILGVIALYSRNIWGGVLVHAGIALLMDFSAMLFAST